MNITTGNGQQSWRPQRLRLDAYAALPLGTPSETLGPEIITARLSYGALGTCRSGTLTLASMPAGWDEGAFPRLLRLSLASEHGTGRVYAGVVSQARHEQGGGATVDLIGVHDVYADASMSVGGPLTYPQLVAQERIFGTHYAVADFAPHRTRNEAWSKTLEPYPGAEWGVGPDMVGVAGLPEYATPATYTRDSRALDLRNLGYAVPDYVTDSVFDPGDGWAKTIARRDDTPAFAPRRAGAATANPSTLPVDTPLTLRRITGVWKLKVARDTLIADGQKRTYRDPGAIITPGGNPIVEVGVYELTVPPTLPTVRRGQRVTVTVPYRLEDLLIQEGEATQRAELIISLERDPVTDGDLGGLGSIQTTLDEARRALDLAASFELPTELVKAGGTYRVRLMLTLRGTRREVGLVIGPIKATLTAEQANHAAKVEPAGWESPYWQGPTYEFKLPGWHVPPLRVQGLPGGLSQYVAGAEVTWNRGEASTKVLTAALPYAGQRRR